MRSIEDIILEKKYSELSPEELVMVSELAENEEEFNQMKQLFDNMSFGFGTTESFAASAETKSSLDSVFTAKHPVIANDWKKEEVAEEVKVVAFYNRNWVRVAAILLVFLGISVVYIQNAEQLDTKSEPQQAKAETAPGKTSTNPSEKDNYPAESKAVEPAESEVILAAIPKVAENKPDLIPEHSEVYLKIQDEAKDQSWAIDDVNQFGATSFSSPSPSSTSLTGATYSYSTSQGLASDLYPNGRVDAESKASISDVPASDMLDWIQAAY